MEINLKKLTIVLLGGVVIVGCGRKGPLEMPMPSAEKSVQGDSVVKKEKDKPFILDRLIK
ncbi:putative small lipoprotein YifL [Bartonella silvatica]|uniref:Small lipoprotein YifL n=1 Tax=Bartonella silvatica TaxID=357760 RepID=A0ABV2HG05_9HYPH